MGDAGDDPPPPPAAADPATGPEGAPDADGPDGGAENGAPGGGAEGAGGMPEGGQGPHEEEPGSGSAVADRLLAALAADRDQRGGLRLNCVVAVDAGAGKSRSRRVVDRCQQFAGAHCGSTRLTSRG